MEIKDIVKQLDQEFTLVYESYIKLHEQFNTYRGKPVESEAKRDEINEVLVGIQHHMMEMVPVLNYIGSRAQFVGNVIDEFNRFIDEMKKSGAVVNVPEEQEVIS